MKTKLLLLLVLWAGVVWGQRNEFIFTRKAKEMGFVAYLTQLKYKSEIQMNNLINEKPNEKSKKEQEENRLKKEKIYKSLKISVDVLLNQMLADLYKSNSLRLYRSADKYIKKQEEFPEKYSSYKDFLKHIDSLSNSLSADKNENNTNDNLKSMTESSGFFDIVLASDWTSVGTLVFDVFKTNQENRQKKVENMVTILNQLRLKNISELKEKDEDKKEKQ
ncbi:MAG: hypothetical protein DI529_17615 [Chryseobacterium sp.]|nr:MAG: hypothetical protein DI529_17615 [Chryseobacterium sp.]